MYMCIPYIELFLDVPPLPAKALSVHHVVSFLEVLPDLAVPGGQVWYLGEVVRAELHGPVQSLVCTVYGIYIYLSPDGLKQSGLYQVLKHLPLTPFTVDMQQVDDHGLLLLSI